jgi:hypothetical protein
MTTHHAKGRAFMCCFVKSLIKMDENLQRSIILNDQLISVEIK